MNMQIVHTGLSGRVFALPRCSSDSRDKKTRNRRSKEERRTMVESFIKTYQDSNNGKFPSLNLTHKEVGGSFYTVREIVREIIQDNRVLGPGNINSKLLNLEDCYENQADESISLNNAAHLSIATINQPTDQREEIVFPPPTENIRASEEIVDESGHQEFTSHLNDLISDVGNGKQHDSDVSSGISLSSNLVNLECEEMDAEARVKVKEDSETIMVDQQLSRENVSVTSPENMVNDSEPAHKIKNTSEKTNSSDSSKSPPKTGQTDGLLETNFKVNSIIGTVSDQVSYDTVDSSLAYAISKVSNIENPREVEALETYNEVSETCSAKVGGTDTDRNSVVNEAHSSSVVDNTPAGSHSEPVSGDVPAPMQPVFEDNGSVILTNGNGNASHERLHISGNGTAKVLEAARKRGIKNTTTAGNSNSISSEESSKEQEGPQRNLVFDIIGSFISAFVKFWTT